MIGDVLLTSLLCENIKKNYPDYQIDYLVNSNTLPVLDNNPYIDNIIVFDEIKNKGLYNILRFSRNIDRNNYDIIIDAYSKLQSWVNVALNKAPVKISYKKIGREFIYSVNVVKHSKPRSNLGLSIEHRLSLLKPLGITEPTATFPKLYLSTEEIRFAKEIFKKFGIDKNRKTIMISLLGSDLTKTYPLKEMAKVVNYIGENFNVNILFNYFPKQKELALEVFNQLSDKTKENVNIDVLGSDLREFIAIANECDMIVGNDGGAINMSKALGKQSFIIFSPWIDKSVWATFEDGINHESVHLKDYKPDIFKNLTNKEIKKDVYSFYNKFKFDLFKQKLEYFLNRNI